GVEGLHVRGGHIRQRGLPPKNLADLVEVEAELAQRAHEIDAGDGFDVVHPVPGGRARRRRDDAFVRPKPDRSRAQARAPGQLADGEQCFAVTHGAQLRASSQWKVKITLRSLDATGAWQSRG